ncbi:predicted protein [Histoplasma capsulatum H143]|uniref:Uncharacterized protein n=1 Tax=Ajellomyces capsulatus (strain H143) TaxID=544712 RepID=C6HK65_AJECH|nr:predicted protein [Histoplasma capsulatum H143]
MGARRVSGRRERISPVPGRETLACMAGSDVALMGFSSYIPISYRPAKNLYCHFKAQPQRVSTQGVQLSQKSPFTDLQLPAFHCRYFYDLAVFMEQVKLASATPKPIPNPKPEDGAQQEDIMESPSPSLPAEDWFAWLQVLGAFSLNLNTW